ncbi:MAG TPA: ABC transporter ATP-binding protein [Thermoanaerobaculia bacterium]|nr:ABC transporter ATP-binding protein [Thermoanaerobaculia bacterium]
MTPFLLLDRLAKTFGDDRASARRVLDGLTLAVERGEVVALLGPSGSGKTTALRLIAGFETLDPGGGRVLVEGQDVSGLPPSRRNFGMVFQHYALFPHLTVGENVAFGLESRRLDRGQVRSRVAAALALVDLPGFERRRVGEISGGQQQRVALARALAPEPRVLLLDEPLSNLDPALRERTRRELRRAIRRVGITTLLVTHEQEEAFYLGDRVAVLESGMLHQAGTPEELYDRPATRFVATFVGRASVLPGTFEGAGTAGLVRLDDLPVGPVGPVGPAGAADAGGGSTGAATAAAGAGPAAWPGVAAEPLAAGDAVELVVRPEALALVPAGAAGAVTGRVAERRYAGAVTYYLVELPGAPALEIEVAAGTAAAVPGDEVGVAPAAGKGAAAPGRIFRRSAPGSRGWSEGHDGAERPE